MIIIGIMIGVFIGVILMCIVRMWDMQDATMIVQKFYDTLLKEYRFSSLSDNTNEYRRGLLKAIEMYKTYFEDELSK